MTDFVYCVVGASGFLGAHLLRQLAANGVRPVRCLSRIEQAPAPAVEWLVGNLHDEGALRNLIVKNSIVVNLAFDATATRFANISAAQTLGRICVEAQARRLMHISTATVAGGVNQDVVDETTPCTPGSGYEQTKLDVEQALLAATRQKVETTILRPTAVFGKGGRNLLKLAQQVAMDNALQRRLLAYLNGVRRMNLVAAENVIAAVEHLAAAPADVSQGCFIVSDDDSANNNYAYVASRLAGAFGKPLPELGAARLPSPILRTLLQLRGRSNVNPRRRYSCEKLLATGFRRPATFESALEAYAAVLATQWTQHRNIIG